MSQATSREAEEGSLQPLPRPQVVSCYFEDGFSPPLAAMVLAWPDAEERQWSLPEGVQVFGPPPAHFGLLVRRRSLDSYNVNLVWNRLCLSWSELGRQELLACSLPLLLAALGSDADELLDQPIDLEAVPACAIAGV